MKDSEKLVLFRQYMLNKGIDREKVEYNVKVVNYFVNTVLFFFDETLESFDSFTFDEFTDKITLIDEELGGREGIKDILSAMRLLTEFLKDYKFIKGGKIAFYKRMFEKEEYYLQKYDMLKGKKSQAKEIIKNVLNEEFSKKIISIAEDINVGEFETMLIIDKILNDIPFSEDFDEEKVQHVKKMLHNLELIELKKTNYNVTRLGRMLSRLESEQRYAYLLCHFFEKDAWFDNIVQGLSFEDLHNLRFMIITTFGNKDSFVLENNNKFNLKHLYIGLDSDINRLNIIERNSKINILFEIFYTGMGLIEKNVNKQNLEYKLSAIGKYIIKHYSAAYYRQSRHKLTSMAYIIRNKKYDEAEKEIEKYLVTFGENSIILDFLGQVLLLEKKYKHAYEILKYAYNTANKRSNAFKSIIYHLVLCCRKLKMDEETKFYEERLMEISNKA
ncbi:hypothetical protein ABG79_00266 [Caloramator mitchellensis]|uniref:Tetratricopeptide repeat protein n=1 Tax=Caloramator mitchellensis TaxID=908809 RepID=A0A0R3JX31_CALMK|nr:hypothetical protein [Caloramator mitchellensis]KRQ88099.1 hypothetical protein ABG79_00266 [Caloramator mitchellensis]